MNNLTNIKIEALVPKWRPFYGISLLFDNPGKSLIPLYEEKEAGLCQLSCSPGIPFYTTLNRCLKSLKVDLPSNDYLLCPLPYDSYHVTVNDLINLENEQDFKPESQARFSAIFRDFPNSLSKITLEELFPGHSEQLMQRDWAIQFKFSHLHTWGDSVLVARLRPADGDADDKFELLKALRREINLRFQANHGKSWNFKDEYDIHLSLAYFGNQEYGRLFQPLKDNWQNYFQDKMKDDQGRDLTIEFNSLSLYGFTDMATFFKVVRKETLY